MARQRYCHRLLRYRNTLRVSADLGATAAALTRAKSRGSPRTRAIWGERQTLRWREPDSNLRSRSCERLYWGCQSETSARKAEHLQVQVQESGVNLSFCGCGEPRH